MNYQMSFIKIQFISNSIFYTCALGHCSFVGIWRETSDADVDADADSDAGKPRHSIVGNSRSYNDKE